MIIIAHRVDEAYYYSVANKYTGNRMYLYLLIFVLVLCVIGIFNVLWLRYNGDSVPAPKVERNTTSIGNGKQVKYLVMGDSTAVGQGGEVQTLATQTAEFIAQDQQVLLMNTAVSGARAVDILNDQLKDGIKQNPDIVLIIVGSNDVTHATSLGSIKSSIQQSVDALITQNCNVKIVLTGSAAMGTVPRIPQPLRFLAGQRTNRVNSVFTDIVKTNNLTFAPIAERTGPIFSKDKSLFAADNFHPNQKGYDVWVPVLNEALEDAITNQPSHCQS